MPGWFAVPTLEISPAPVLPVPDAPPGSPRQRWHDNHGRLVASGGRDGESWWMHWPGLATFWFDETGPVRAIPVAPGRNDDLQDTFLRGVLPVVLLARGFEALHASAVVTRAGATAFCATSGTGKSTLALATAVSGARHLADDTVLYRASEHRAAVVSVPYPIRVPSAAQVAAGLTHEVSPPRVSPSTSEPLHRVYQLVRDRTLDPGAPQFRPVPRPGAFEVLLTHAHPFDMGSDERRRAFLEHLLMLARTVDVWECRFAPSLDALPVLADAVRAHASA